MKRKPANWTVFRWKECGTWVVHMQRALAPRPLWNRLILRLRWWLRGVL